MPSGFPPQPAYPFAIDSDYTLFLVYNTTESKTTAENQAWAEEIAIRPVGEDSQEIWPDNGFATIEGEIFYYDVVEKDENDKVCTLKRCVRNLGGKQTQANPAGTDVRGFVMAEHHNQLVDTVLRIEDFVGVNFTTDQTTLDWRIRNLQALQAISDDHTCVDITFVFNILSEDPATGTVASYNIQIKGNYNNYRLDFGDGTFTTNSLSGTHTYTPNNTIDPVVTVSNSKCTVVQTPSERLTPTEPADVPPTLTDFLIPIPECPDIPLVVLPEITLPPFEINFPPIVLPDVSLSPFGVPSIIIIEPPINIPSFIDFEGINIPSSIVITGPSIPTQITITPPTITFGEAGIPTFITFSNTSIPTIIEIAGGSMPTTITLVGSLPTTITLVGNLPPTITLVSNLSPTITLVSNLSPTITLVSNLSPTITLVSSLSPTITLVDYLPPTITLVDELPTIITLDTTGLSTFINVIFPDPMPSIPVAWTPVPVLSCIVTVVCPGTPMAMAMGAAATNDENFQDSFQAQSDDVTANDLGIPSIIQLVADVPIPQEIRLLHNLPDFIELKATDIPESIFLKNFDIPEFIELRMAADMPKSLKLELTGIPESIQMVGAPTTIQLVGNIPTIIQLVMPEKPEIEMVYRGDPINVKVQLDMNKLLGEQDNAQCVAIVPCGRK